jgi:hypothetical protein
MTTDWADITLFAVCIISIFAVVLLAVFDGDDFPE